MLTRFHEQLHNLLEDTYDTKTGGDVYKNQKCRMRLQWGKREGLGVSTRPTMDEHHCGSCGRPGCSKDAKDLRFFHNFKVIHYYVEVEDANNCIYSVS